MRDAFGGAFMIKIFLIFIIVYVCFTALALNYAKAFKVKNKIIDYLEDAEISTKTDMTAAAFEEMEKYFEEEIYNEMNYRAEVTCTSSSVYCKNGVRVEQIDATTRYGTKAVYYKVTTKVGWSIPFINKILALDKGEGKGAGVTSGNWTISGETRIITSNE